MCLLDELAHFLLTGVLFALLFVALLPCDVFFKSLSLHFLVNASKTQVTVTFLYPVYHILHCNNKSINCLTLQCLFVCPPNLRYLLSTGYLCNSLTEPRGRVGMSVYKPDDRVSRPAVQEAVEAFLSRSQADLDQALPLHVEESLTYLQDHLLDVCQC